MSKLYGGFVVLMFILTFSAAASAQQQPVQQSPNMVQSSIQKVTGFFDDFFTKMFNTEKSIDPTGTLVAPFAQENVKPLSKEERYKAATESNNVAMDQPHRSDRELGEWLMQALAQTLSFDSDNFSELLPQLANGFSPEGLEQFKAWTNESGIMAALRANGLQLNALVTDTPFLLNQGAIAGRFRWLYEVPVMISFIPRGTQHAVRGETPETKQMLVTLQLGRKQNSVLEHGIQIESWSVRAYDRKN